MDFSSLKAFASAQAQVARAHSENFAQWYREQPRWKQVSFVALCIFGFAIAIIIAISHVYLIKIMVTLSDKIHDLRYGWLVLFVLVFCVGFPPLIGFSALSMICGMTYGFPWGWPLLAVASILGSFVSFLVFRYVLHRQAQQLVDSNEKFRAFAEILRDDSSLLLLMLIRLCPLPYSLSNGALAAVPQLSATTYFLASFITSPKMFIHIFVGFKMKELGDETRPTSTRILDFVSIVITGLASALTSYLIYRKMQQKLALYHENPNQYEEMVFGNFDDGMDPNNLELDSNNFDDDNFIIGDEDEDDRDATDVNDTTKPRDSQSLV